jgi:hypothetical protein
VAPCVGDIRRVQLLACEPRAGLASLRIADVVRRGRTAAGPYRGRGSEMPSGRPPAISFRGS